MGVKLMTGATGEQNIQAVDDRECLAGVTGLDSYVFPTAGKLSATLTDSNTLTIGTGAGSLQGARFRCPTTTTVTIESGTQAQYRRDIVGLRFSRASTGKESLAFEVLTGAPASTEAGAEDPAYDEGDLLAGDAEAFMPLYRVKLSGINVGEPEAMFSVLAPLSDLRDSVSQAQRDVASLKSRPRVYTGTAVALINGYHYATMLTASQVAGIAGRALNKLKDSVSVCNGDLDAGDYGIFAYITSGGGVDIRVVGTTGEPPESGPVRVNYALFVA